jgi:hypothetical protein
MEVAIKKEGWSGGGLRQVKVITGIGEDPTLKVSGKTLIVSIGPGLPNTMSNAIHHLLHTFHNDIYYQIHFLDCRAISSIRTRQRNIASSSSCSHCRAIQQRNQQQQSHTSKSAIKQGSTSCTRKVLSKYSQPN